MSGQFSSADLAPNARTSGRFSAADLAPAAPPPTSGAFGPADLAPVARGTGRFSVADLAPAGGGLFIFRKDLPEGPTLGELVGGGYVGPDDLPEPAPELPPGIIERDGVYLRQGPQGALVPVGEKGLEQPLYSPEDLVADILTGGLMGLAKGTGRSLLGHAVAPATKATAKELARLAGKEAVTSGAMGLLAGGTMEATDQATGSKAGALVAGLGLPAAATMLPTAVRHGLMRAARQAPQAAEAVAEGAMGRDMAQGAKGLVQRLYPELPSPAPAASRWPRYQPADPEGVGHVGESWTVGPQNWPPSGQGWLQAPRPGFPEGHARAQVAGQLGTLSENIGEDAFGALQRAASEEALADARVAAETGQYTLRPWVQEVLTKIPYLRDHRALIAGQSLREAVNRIPVLGEALASHLGLTNRQLTHLTSLAEVIPREPLDEAGRLRLGVRGVGADADGNPISVWRHGLDPEAAREAVATLSQAEQKFLMAYVEPAEGYHLPPRLPAAGSPAGEAVDLGDWSLKRLAARAGMSTEAMAANYSTQGRNSFISGFGSGGPEAAQLAQRAADQLEQHMELYIKPSTTTSGGPGQKVAAQAVDRAKDLGNLAPDDGGPPPVLAAQVGRDAAHWLPGQVLPQEIMLPYTPRAPFEKVAGISREANRQRWVEHGLLDPGQVVEGYVTHAGLPLMPGRQADPTPRLEAQAPALSLRKMEPGFTKQRGQNSQVQYPRLDQIITAYRGEGEKAIIKNALLRYLGQNLLRPMPLSEQAVWKDTGKLVPNQFWRSGDTPATRDLGLIGGPGHRPQKNEYGLYTIHRQTHEPKRPHQLEPQDLLRDLSEDSAFAGKRVDRIIPETVVEVPEAVADSLGVEPGYHRLPKYFVERFNMLVGLGQTGQLDSGLRGVMDLARDVARFWKANQLVSPGTVATNLISGYAQYAGKVSGDLVRFGLRVPGYTGRRVLDDFSAPLQALRPRIVEDLPAEILGGNIANQFDDDLSRLNKHLRARLDAGQQVSPLARALGKAVSGTMGATSLALKPFGAVENHLKRVIYLSEVMDLARREAKVLKDQGLKVKPLDLVAGIFEGKPQLHQRTMLGPVDRFAFNYDNVPTKLEKFRGSTLGAMLLPFPIYPYKYARMLLSQLNALNPLSHGMEGRERAARAAELLGPLLGFDLARRRVAGGESQVRANLDQFEEQYPEGGVQVPYPRLGGRDYFGSYVDHGDPGGPRDKELWVRTAKYPYANLVGALRSRKDAGEFVDEFKSTGPMVPIIMNALEADPRQGPRDLPGQLGQVVSGLIPAHRVLEYVSGEMDGFRKRQPKGFMEQVQMAMPGGRDMIFQPEDRGAGQPAKGEATDERLKFWTGVNPTRVDVSDAERTLVAAQRRASEYNIKDSQRLAVYSQLTGLTPEEIKPHLPKIRQAETAALMAQHRVQRAIYDRLRQLGKTDPNNPLWATMADKMMEQVSGRVVTQGLGLRNQHQAMMAQRFEAGAAWINQNLAEKERQP